MLFLTARDSTDAAVRGLTLGGDDHVTKPFSLEELMARVQALLRRAHGRGPSSKLTLADLELDDDAHMVRRASQAVPADQHGPGDGCNDSVVETYISYLRKKIDRFDPPLIHTVRGVGYTMRVM